jgi:DNA-binding XRE family transcriptional regulator
MIKYDTLKSQLLSDPEVVKEYESTRVEFEVAQALILARTEAKMTQAEVATKMHTTQSAIARLESGQHFPSLKTIHKYAIAINKHINLSL